MPVQVQDIGSSKPELLEQAAEVIGRSQHKRRVFAAIYRGKRRTKTSDDLVKATRLPRKRVLDAAIALASHDIVTQTRTNGRAAYEKIPFYGENRDRILRLASNGAARARLVTKRRPAAQPATVRVTVAMKAPRRFVKAKFVTVDDIDNFKRVKRVPAGGPFVKIAESKFKAGVAKLLGERGPFKDWGGELRDLSSTRVKVGGRRRVAAFAFKGPGVSGRLTPGKLGKNGDQIQRLFRCPAAVFFVQYWNEIDDAVLEQMKQFAELKAFFEAREVLYGIIDGADSARLLRAYPVRFGISGPGGKG